MHLEIRAEGAVRFGCRLAGAAMPCAGSGSGWVAAACLVHQHGLLPLPCCRERWGGLEMENVAALGIFSLRVPCDTPWGGHLISTGSLTSPARSCHCAPFCACLSPLAGLHLPCCVPEFGPQGKQNCAKPTEAKYTPSSLQCGIANPSSGVWGS